SADTSETVLLGVTAVAMVTAQPTEKAVCPGGSAVFSIGATGATAYQWQVDTGSGFTNLTDAGNYSGVNTDALEVSGATESMHGYQYRCVLTGCGPGVNTAAATLSIYAPLVINRQPSDTLVCSGTNANISVTATGAITGYQWQESTDGGNTFTSIAGATSPVLALNNVDISWAGKQYRCTITGSCSSIGSGAAVLGVFPAPVFNIVNAPVALCKSDAGVGLAATLGGGIWSGDGVVANKFEPSVAGIGNAEVTYTVTNAQGCTAEQSISIIVNDCSERHLALSNPQSIVIYANPSSSGRINVWIRTDLYSQLMLKVYASDGKLVGNHSLPGLYYDRHIPVDLGRLPDGVYQLFFYNEEGGHLVKKTLKLVIAR
ncbi:MAG TPA: hypothetical protein VFO70_02640, partial [Chitinophagaceae bacterium]|nr:hypothetical protein [Chitinophagaceae bacterium]